MVKQRVAARQQRRADLALRARRASAVDPSRTAATSRSLRTITRSTTVVSHPTKTVRATTTPAASCDSGSGSGHRQDGEDEGNQQDRKLTAHEHSREPQWESAALTPVRGRNTRFPISVVALTVLYA